jgi:hypothetical protein
MNALLVKFNETRAIRTSTDAQPTVEDVESLLQTVLQVKIVVQGAMDSAVQTAEESWRNENKRHRIGEGMATSQCVSFVFVLPTRHSTKQFLTIVTQAGQVDRFLPFTGTGAPERGQREGKAEGPQAVLTGTGPTPLQMASGHF